MSRTLFTSREGGNLKEKELRNILCEELSLEELIFMHQTHSDLIEIVDVVRTEYFCDALVTRNRGVGLAALAADCMPITFSSPAVVGVAHVGRVGLFKGIATKVVGVMRQMGATEIRATIGPSICGRCYEVSPQMYVDSIAQLPATATTSTLYALNLQGGVTFQLNSLGVEVENLGICTLENPNYFSYRKGDEIFRQAGIVAL